MSLYPLSYFLDYNKFSLSHRYFLAFITVELELTKYSNAISNPKWRLSMKKEVDALEQIPRL